MRRSVRSGDVKPRDGLHADGAPPGQVRRLGVGQHGPARPPAVRL